MDIQMKKGFLEAGVLFNLDKGDSYGYRITTDINRVIPIQETTLYPVLRRLENQGALRTYTMEYNGRLRKYYSITEHGKKQCESLRSDLIDMKDVIDQLLMIKEVQA